MTPEAHSTLPPASPPSLSLSLSKYIHKVSYYFYYYYLFFDNSMVEGETFEL